MLLLAGCSRKPAETSVFIDPQFAALVPPDTTLLVGLRVENLVKTPIYQKYLSGGKIHDHRQIRARHRDQSGEESVEPVVGLERQGRASCWGAANLPTN